VGKVARCVNTKIRPRSDLCSRRHRRPPMQPCSPRHAAPHVIEWRHCYRKTSLDRLLGELGRPARPSSSSKIREVPSSKRRVRKRWVAWVARETTHTAMQALVHLAYRAHSHRNPKIGVRRVGSGNSAARPRRAPLAPLPSPRACCVATHALVLLAPPRHRSARCARLAELCVARPPLCSLPSPLALTRARTAL
jgi:hypothetical protein